MTKPVCCLFLALGLAACAPKAVEVPQAQAPTETRGTPTNRTSPGPVGPQEPQAPQLVNQNSGMRIPEEKLLQLPKQGDMNATTPSATPGGGVTATPPTADKRTD